ncbi:MAG: hypothetical protein LBT08_05275 [Synergistaceae bacterium]|jgi:hypothetical protein|nr:hypothetical protein [Synergistaceae bacterium]
MSSLVVATSTYNLLEALAVKSGLGASVAGTHGFESERGWVKKYLRNEVLNFIAHQQARIDRSNDRALWGGSYDELEALKNSLDERMTSNAGIDRITDGINAIKREMQAAEIDGWQCRSRTESVRGLIRAIRAANAAVYEAELVRLEGELEKICVLPAEARLLELQGVLDQLIEMDRLKDAAASAGSMKLEEHRYVYEPDKASSRAESVEASKPTDGRELFEVIREIRDWAGRIEMLDDEEGDRIEPLIKNLRADTAFPDRLVQLRQQVRRTWGAIRERASLTAFFRDCLADIMKLLEASRDAVSSEGGVELVRRFEAINAEKYIERDDAMRLYEDIAKFILASDMEIADAVFTKKVQSALAEMGYELLSDYGEGEIQEGETPPAMMPGQVHWLESPYEGYRVMVKIGEKGEFTARLVRAVDEGEDDIHGELQERNDIEAGKKWCGDLDGFLEYMRETGLPLEAKIRREPEETELMTVKVHDSGGRRKKGSKREKAGRSAQRALPGYGGDDR